MSVTVELSGLEIEGRHGVEDEERARPQPFLYDVRLEVSDAALSDRVEDTVDYREVVQLIRQVSDGRQFRLLEAMAAAVADTVLASFAGVECVRVRVRKPEVRLAAPVEWTAATVQRRRL